MRAVCRAVVSSYVWAALRRVGELSWAERGPTGWCGVDKFPLIRNTLRREVTAVMSHRQGFDVWNEHTMKDLKDSAAM